MEYIFMEDHVKFMTYKLKEGQRHGESIAKHPYDQGKPLRKLLQTPSLALEEKEMKNRPQPVMRSYRSNETAELQQLSIEEQSTKRNSSSTDTPATNNQMSGKNIQTDVVFFPKPQEIVSQVKSLDDVNLVMKLMPSIRNSKEEAAKTHAHMRSR